MWDYDNCANGCFCKRLLFAMRMVTFYSAEGNEMQCKKWHFHLLFAIKATINGGLELQKQLFSCCFSLL